MRLAYWPVPAALVDSLARSLPKEAWARMTIKEGSKGPLVCDFACLRIVEARAGLLAVLMLKLAG